MKKTLPALLLILTITLFAKRFAPLRGPRMKVPAHYPSIKKINKWAERIKTEFPEYIKVKRYGSSHEAQKQNKKNLIAVEISHKEYEPQTRYLITAGIHARELMTTYTAIKFTNLIIKKIKSGDKSLKNFLKKAGILVMPLLNPDGYKMALRGWNWRKNTHVYKKYPLKWAPNSYGVNVNQNFDVNFRRIHKPHTLEWGGPYPFSEPESRAIRDYLKGKKIYISVALHSYGRLIAFPWWGKLRRSIPDKRRHVIMGRELQKRMHRFKLQEGCPYLVPGNFGDWIYATNKCLTFTFEIGDCFNPEMKYTKIWYKEIEAGLLYLLGYMKRKLKTFPPPTPAE